MSTALRFAACGLMLLPACGDDDKKTAGDVANDATTVPDGTDTTTAGDTGDGGGGAFSARVAKAYCDTVKTCFATYDTGENFIAMLLREATEAECIAWIERALLRDDLAWDAAIAAGELTVDETKLSSCLAALTSTCGTSNLFTGACQEIVEGKVAPGGACTSGQECAGDAYCEGDTGCGGVCAGRVGLEAPCEESDACSNASAARECSFESSRCVAVTMRDGAQLGEECGDVHGEDGVSLVKCAAPNVCESGECQAIVPAGGACTSDRTPCAVGHVCWPDSPDEGAAATCKRVAVADAEGADCREALGDPAAVFCNPVLFLGCKDGKCARIGDGSAGSTCFNDQDPRVPCNEGLYCDDASFTCMARKGAGAPCERDQECLSDFCNSDGETSSCLGSERCP